MKTETTRVIAFSQNQRNSALAANSNSLIPAESEIGASAIKPGTAAAESAGGRAAATTVGAFFKSKAGIILLSAIGIVVVAVAVVVPIVVTQTGDDDDNGNNKPVSTADTTNNNNPGIQDIATDNNNENENDKDNEDNYWTDPTEDSGQKLKLYSSDMLSLTQANFYESEIVDTVTRSPPSEYNCINSSVNFEILYGGDNSAINSKYAEILEENEQLIPSSTTFDKIDADGKLYLNGVDTGRTLFKHIFSKGLYGGNVDDSEQAVKKKIKLNPVSTTNYITGLYAPPGEVITVEISQEDLTNIGGSLTFLIGFYTHNNVYSVNRESIGIKRVPNLSYSLAIDTTTGYIGSFLGGPIYISNPSKSKQFTVTISGAVRYKHILFGITTKSDFEAMSGYSAPFFELDIRDTIRYSGGVSIIQNYDYNNLMNNLIFWDKCVRTSRKVPSGSNTNLAIHFLFDPCVNSNGALALAYVGRNWCQVPPSFGMALDFETMTKYGAWGHIHELNHHFQKFGFNSVSNEVTNNVINIVEYILYTQLSGLRNAYSNAALLKISGNHNYMNPEYIFLN